MSSRMTRREQQERSQKLLLLVVRLLFMVMIVTVTLLTVASQEQRPQDFEITTVVGLILAAVAFGIVVLVVDSRTPNKRLTSTVGVYLGICVGLIGALAIGALLDVVAEAWGIKTSSPGQTPTRVEIYLGLVKVIIAIVLCYLAVSVVITTKDDFRLVIPYVEFAKQIRGVRPLVLDTSAIIDGRIEDLGQSGFVDAPLVVPQFVIDELQRLADSSDKLKRARGRRGLEMVTTLQSNSSLDVTIDPTEVPGHSVDHMLLQLAADQKLRVLTTDYNLNKVGRIQGVTVLNLNDLSSTLRPQLLPGETLKIEIARRGEGPTQGVGYLPDGTMVVVEDAADRIEESIEVVVTNSLQTTAGRMIFARPSDHDAEAANEHAALMAQAATQQPRSPARPQRAKDAPSARNPRR